MPAALDKPVFLAAFAESVFAICSNTRINQNRLGIIEIDACTNVIMVVPFVIMATLCRKESLPFAHKANIGIRIIDKRIGPILRCLCLHFTHCRNCFKTLIEKRPVGIFRIASQCMITIHGKIHHPGIPTRFPIAIYRVCEGAPRGLSIGEVHLPAVVDIGIDDELSQLFQEWMIPKRNCASGDTLQVLKIIHEETDGFVPVGRSFIASAIGGQGF